MEFAEIDGNFGVVYYSQNREYLLLRSTKNPDERSVITVVHVASNEVMYKYQIGYCQDVAVSNLGFTLAIDKHIEEDFDFIYCIDPDGGLLFKKKSFSVPSALAFDNDSKNAVVSFFGSDQYVECYSIVWFDLENGNLSKAIQAPGLRGAHKIWFDDNNGFQWS